jgi:hypothetical protein
MEIVGGAEALSGDDEDDDSDLLDLMAYRPA